MGTTPFTWTKPVYGKVNVTISKSGYEDEQESFEFTGGSMRKSFTLERKRVVAPPPEPPKKEPPQRSTPTRSVAKSTPAQKPPPVEDDPFADIDENEDFSFDEEPEPVSTPPKVSTPSRTTTAPSRPTASTGGGGGGTALIFIASIPPVADVYIGDKLIGKTNVSELKIPAGVQTLKFVKGGKEITKQLNLKPGKNPSQMVRIP
jgi:hypothetical protein